MTHLLSNNLGKLLIAMTERVDGNTRRKVKVFAVLQVPEVRALALDEDGRRARVGGHHVRSGLADELAADGVLGRVGVGDLSGGIGTAGTGAGEAGGRGRGVDGGDPAEGGAEGHGDGWTADGRMGRRRHRDQMEEKEEERKKEAQPVKKGKGRTGRSVD